MKVEGLSKLNAQLKKLGNELGRKTLAKSARKAFKPVLEKAKALVPKDTGELAESLRIGTSTPKNGDAAVAVGIVIRTPKGGDNDALPPARRWHFVELGTVNKAASPFLRPSLDENADKVVQLLKVEVAKAIDKAVKKRGGG